MAAEGINKLVTYKKQTGFGAIPTNSGGFTLPRESANFQGAKGTISSALINPSQQKQVSRHGARSATGSLSTEIMPGTYHEFIEAALRRDFPTSSLTTGALTNITVSASTPSHTRATGSFITDGFRAGMIVTSTNVSQPLNAGKSVIVSVTATQMDMLRLDKEAWVAQASGSSITIAQAGESTYTPTTGHTRDFFYFEEWRTDVLTSKKTQDQQVNSINFTVSPAGMAKMSIDFVGADFGAPSNTRYFASPTVLNSTGSVSSSSGLIVIGGMKSCRLTSFNGTIAVGVTQQEMIACDGIGATARDQMMFTGSFTAVIDDDSWDQYFWDEAEVEFIYVFTTQDGEALSFYCPRLKINSISEDDGAGVSIVTVNFEALEYVGANTGIQATTLLVNDTTL